MSIMMKEIQEQPEVLKRCMSGNVEKVKSIIKLVKDNDIHTVYIAARGTSDHAGVYGKYLIELLTGLPVALAASSIVTIYGGSIRFDKCLVIGISQSGEAADVLGVIKQANENGGLTVSITNNSQSPLAQNSQFHLDCMAGVEKSVAATKTFTSQMLLLAMLAVEMSGRQDIKLEEIPDLAESVITMNSNLAKKVERFRYMNECFVLGRGINYAATLEMALKIQETTYVRAKAFAVSDFQHGPIAMACTDIPTIILAAKGPALKDMKDMITRLQSEGIELIVISDQNDLCDLATCGMQIPESNNEIISVFLQVIVAQMFACNLAMIRGLNPDVPRRLNKVTVTI